MSVGFTQDGKVAKGYKRCPACGNAVKGPRTKLCPCGHEFVAKSKPVAIAVKPTAVPVPPAVAVTPDPYTFNLNVNQESGAGVKGSTIRSWAVPVRGIEIPKKTARRAREVMGYAAGILEPEFTAVDNIVTIA